VFLKNTSDEINQKPCAIHHLKIRYAGLILNRILQLKMKAHFVSTLNGETYAADDPIWQSPEGHLLDLVFDAGFDLSRIASRSAGMWRYREAIPIANDSDIVSLGEGLTPMVELVFQGRKVWVKQDQLFSTGSYKDRGASVLISKARSLGIRRVVQDSSGNAGCAIAAYSARASIACDIFLPSSTSEAKVAQIAAYGAAIHRVPGSREDTAKAALQAASMAYYASHCYNPYFLHGTKTFAYEVCEQLGWKAPHSLVLPCGNGTLVLGCSIGFTDLLKAGIISHMPKLIAVQAENCSPLASRAANKPLSANQPTLAEGIAIAEPVRGAQIIAKVNESKGCFITVTEEEIKRAWTDCARRGFYIEPTSAATIAGLEKYIPMQENGTIVSLFTGHGLKAVKS
jgi:threonine synthase